MILIDHLSGRPADRQTSELILPVSGLVPPSVNYGTRMTQLLLLLVLFLINTVQHLTTIDVRIANIYRTD